MQAFFTSRSYDCDMAQKYDQERGKHLRELRQKVKLSQSELAQQLGVHRSNIGFWENTGVIPRSDLLVLMAEVLGVTVEDLLSNRTTRKRSYAPAGRARMIFESVSKLPRRQQQKIAEVVEALVEKNTNGHRQAA